MREIKFRAWDTKRNKMHFPEEMGRDQLTLCPNNGGFTNVSSISTRLSQYLNHLIPEQFTGLHDKDGKEIYEGDIYEFEGWEVRNGHQIRPKRKPRVVEWKIDKLNTLNNIISCNDTVKVIGNIHETKLLAHGGDDE